MDHTLDQTGTPQPGDPGDAEGPLHALAERTAGVADEVRERLPDLVDAGGRVVDQAVDQVVQHAPAAIDASIELIDRSSTTVLATVAGACAGLSAGLLLARAPRFLGLVLGAMGLVLGGTLLGRRGAGVVPWE